MNTKLWDYIARNIHSLSKTLENYPDFDIVGYFGNIGFDITKNVEIVRESILCGLVDVRAIRLVLSYQYSPSVSKTENSHIMQFFAQQSRVRHQVADKTTHSILLGQIPYWMNARLLGYKASNPHLYSRNFFVDWGGDWTPYLVVIDKDPHYTYIVEVGRDKHLMNCYYDLETGLLLEKGDDAFSLPYISMEAW